MKKASLSFMGRVVSSLRTAFSQNLGLKVLSLVLALGLMAYQRSSEGEEQRTVPVDVIFRLPPAGARRQLMTVVPPNSVHVTVRGSNRALDQLTSAGIPAVEVDLRRGDAHQIVFEPGMLAVPPGVQVNIIDPATIDLEWQNVVERSVPIQASTTGRVADGYTVQSVKVDPTSIAVRGPASLVDVMQFVRVAAFDVSGKTEGIYRHPLALDEPGQGIQYLSSASATVTVTVGRQLLQRRFTRRVVSVVGPPRAKTEPKNVDVSVTGPPEVINSLRDEMIVPRVDVAGAGYDRKERHASIVLPVRLDLRNVEVEVQPPTVSVTW